MRSCPAPITGKGSGVTYVLLARNKTRPREFFLPGPDSSLCARPRVRDAKYNSLHCSGAVQGLRVIQEQRANAKVEPLPRISPNGYSPFLET